jgi:hypothetical protein
MDRVHVLMFHPRTNFDSSIWPSARSFFREMMSFLGIRSVASSAFDKA